MQIKFISYDGEYPNLCSGRLIVEIDGKKITFEGYCKSNEKTNHYPKFWTSGGSVSFDYDWNECVLCGEWQLEANEKNYPKDISILLPFLLELMNDNVSYGCCGGCV